MRAFNFAATACIVLSLLCASASAFEEQSSFKKAGTVDPLKEDYTNTWNFADNTHREFPPVEGLSMIGMVLGFGATFIFFVTAVILIVRDEIIRHRTYEKLIERDIRRLKTDHKQSDEDVERILKEFDEAEEKRGQAVDATAAAKELAEIN